MHIHVKSNYERRAQEEINQMQVIHPILLFQNTQKKLFLNTTLKN